MSLDWGDWNNGEVEYRAVTTKACSQTLAKKKKITL